MCLGIPARIVSISPERPHIATVETRGSRHEVNIAIVQEDQPRPGMWVEIHMGMAVSLLDPAEAEASLEFLQELEDARLGGDTTAGEPEAEVYR